MIAIIPHWHQLFLTIENHITDQLIGNNLEPNEHQVTMLI
jgi:hypothetical protein